MSMDPVNPIPATHMPNEIMGTARKGIIAVVFCVFKSEKGE